MPRLQSKPTAKRPPMTDEPEEQTVAEKIATAEIPEVVEPNSGDVIPDETAEEETAPEPEPEAPKKTTARRKPANQKQREATAKAVESKAAPALAGLGSLFTPLNDVEDKLNILYWGREGTSKTTNAATLANMGRTLVINAEGGLKKTALRRQGINVDNIAVWPKPNQPITYDGLEEVYQEVKSDLEDDPNSWTGVVFDSATDIVQAMVDRVSSLRIGKVKDRGILVDEVEQWTTDRNDFGVMSKQFRDILRKFRDLHCHVVITALERRDVDEDTQKVSYGPAVSPALQTDLLGYVDVVMYTRAPDEDRDFFRASTKKAGAFRSKDRFGNLPAVLVNPTVERVLAYVEDQITEDVDPQQEAIAEANRLLEERREAAKAAKEAAKTRAAEARAKRATGRATKTAAKAEES
ncbi:putative recombinase [Curtobacterium phage Parvaparticeps]|nr:putative recombinase [Curtobacterium phage Parvaparticeps]